MEVAKRNVGDVRDALADRAAAQRRVLARLRLCRMQLRRAGKLSLTGYEPPPVVDVQRLWRDAGWLPSRREGQVSPSRSSIGAD